MTILIFLLLAHLIKYTGIMVYDSEKESFYDGEWVDGIKEGYGMRRYKSGNYYKGIWFNNQRHGIGIMHWVHLNEIYEGEWKNGIQHGYGKYSWFVKRAASSQYLLANSYEGFWVDGKRQDHGTFYYPSGAVYEGQWFENNKHGGGKLILKNGEVFMRYFNHNRMPQYLGILFNPAKNQTPPEKSPSLQGFAPPESPLEGVLKEFVLDLDNTLSCLPQSLQDEEYKQAIYITIHHMPLLRQIYALYSNIGQNPTVDNTSVMKRFQFWRFLKDIYIHHKGLTIPKVNEITELMTSGDVQSPIEKMTLREFIQALITVSYHIYSKELVDVNCPILSECFSRLINEQIMEYAGKIQSDIYTDLRKADVAAMFRVQIFENFKFFCEITRKPDSKKKPKTYSMTMREFLLMMKNLKLIDSNLTTKNIINILAHCDSKVIPDKDSYNLDIEMSYLEFEEVLFGCASLGYNEDYLNLDEVEWATKANWIAKQHSFVLPNLRNDEDKLMGTRSHLLELFKRETSPGVLEDIEQALASKLLPSVSDSDDATSDIPKSKMTVTPYLAPTDTKQSRSISRRWSPQVSASAIPTPMNIITDEDLHLELSSTDIEDYHELHEAKEFIAVNLPLESKSMWQIADYNDFIIKKWEEKVTSFFKTKFFPVVDDYIMIDKCFRDEYKKKIRKSSKQSIPVIQIL